MPRSSNLDDISRHLGEAVRSLERLAVEPQWDQVTLDCLGALLKEALHITRRLDPQPQPTTGDGSGLGERAPG